MDQSQKQNFCKLEIKSAGFLYDISTWSLLARTRTSMLNIFIIYRFTRTLDPVQGLNWGPQEFGLRLVEPVQESLRCRH